MLDLLKNWGVVEQGVIRATTADCFLTDPLRILQAVRLASESGFTIDPATEEGMAKQAPLLSQVPAASIVEEILLILTSAKSSVSVQLLDRLGVWAVIFPEIRPMQGCTQNSYHHRDVWQHSLVVMANCEHILNNLPQYLRF